jgi:hypothetical protein
MIQATEYGKPRETTTRSQTTMPRFPESHPGKLEKLGTFYDDVSPVGNAEIY